MHEILTNSERRTLTIAASWLSSALGDLGHQRANVTRLTRLYQGSELEIHEFMATARAAYSELVPKIPGLRRPMAYWFRLLEDLLQPDVGITASDAMALRELPY